MPGSRAEKYLEKRGLPADQIGSYGLGVVAEPFPGHEQYEGMLAFPYLRCLRLEDKRSVVSMRFRCIEDHEHQGHGKYNTTHGDHPRLYNTPELLRYPYDEVAITEGEIDAITATVSGVPAVSVPGATSWKPHFGAAFAGRRIVWVIADGDTPGRTFAREVCQSVFNARPLYMDDGYDVNSFVLKHGPEALRERIKDEGRR